MRIQSIFNDAVVGCEVLTTARKDFVRHYKGDHGVYLPHGQGLLHQAKDNEHRKRKHQPSLIALILHWVKASGALDNVEDQNLFIVSDRIQDADNQLWMGVILSGFVVPTGSGLMNYADDDVDDDFNEIYAGDLCLSEADFLTKLPLLTEHFKRYLTKHGKRKKLSVILDIADQSLLDKIEDGLHGVNVITLDSDDLDLQIRDFSRKAINACTLKPIKGVVPVKTITVGVITAASVYFGYGYYQDRQLAQQKAQEQAERTQQSIKLKQLKDLQSEKAFYERFAYLNANSILGAILKKLPNLTYLKNGWQLSSVEFKEDSLGQIWLTYKRENYGSVHGLLDLYKSSKAASVLVTDQDTNQAKFSVPLYIVSNAQSMTRELFTNDGLRLTDKNNLIDTMQQYGLGYQVQALQTLKDESLNTQINNIVAHARNLKATLHFEQLKVVGKDSIGLMQLLDALSKTEFTTIELLTIQFDSKQMNNFQFTGVTYA
jgi:hypothetical protein